MRQSAFPDIVFPEKFQRGIPGKEPKGFDKMRLVRKTTFI
jgi:hypothetical protein